MREKILIFSFIVAVAASFWLGRVSLEFWQKRKNLIQSFEENLIEIKLPEIKVHSGEEEAADVKLQVLSMNMIGLWSQTETSATGQADSASETGAAAEQAKLTGIRVVGEVKNESAEIITAAQPVVRFYQADNNQLLATKIGQWSEGYQFVSLAPGEVNVFDLIVTNPPSVEAITLEMRGTAAVPTSSAGGPGSFLKVKEKKFEEAVVEKGDQKAVYYKLTGILVNTGQQEIINPRISAWIKDDQNKVIAVGYKEFSADLLAPQQELEANLILIPFSSGSGTVFSQEVKVWGEEITH